MTAAAPRRSFWHRQAAGDPGAGQIVFDLLFGIVFPVICLIADPIVFRSELGNKGLLGGYAVFAYVLIGGQMLTLLLWLALHRRLGKSGAWFAGPLAAGAAFSGIVGLVLLPFSLLGLVVVIGALGFTPWLTSFVFLRNSIRAAKRSKDLLSPGLRGALLAGGLLCSLLPAVAADRCAKHLTALAVERPETVDPHSPLAALIDAERVVVAYEACPGGPRKEALAAIYRRLTGVSVEDRLMTRSD